VEAPIELPSASATLGAEFMTLLLAQLKHQNPLEPLDDQALIAQMTQVNSLQELQKINTGIAALSGSSDITEASVLIGKEVDYITPDGETGSGLVTGFTVENGQIMLSIDDKSIPVSFVIGVSQPVEEK
jgi:flagellar basal-body rod modification protein FlgD